MEAKDAQQVADAIRNTGRKAAAKRMHATEFDCLNAALMIERLLKEFQAMKEVDYMRYTEIIEELSDYDPSVKAARVGSTVTIGEIVEMAKAAGTNDRNEAQSRIIELEQERDAALAEVERLKANITHEAEKMANKWLDAMYSHKGIGLDQL